MEFYKILFILKIIKIVRIILFKGYFKLFYKTLELIKVKWSPHMCFLSMKVNKSNIFDYKKPVKDRVSTDDGPDYMC